jgi:hypothetical protein
MSSDRGYRRAGVRSLANGDFTLSGTRRHPVRVCSFYRTHNFSGSTRQFSSWAMWKTTSAHVLPSAFMQDLLHNVRFAARALAAGG